MRAPLQLAASLTALMLSTASPAFGGSRTEFDPTSPAHNIEAWVKLAGDTSGRPSYRVTNLVAYAVPHDTPSRALFTLRSISRTEYRRIPGGGYESRSIACGAYFDVAGRVPITSFKDPLDGKEVAASPFCGLVGGERLTPSDGIRLNAAFEMESSIFNRPYVLDWQIDGKMAHVDRVAHTLWTEPTSGRRKAEMTVDSYYAPVKDFLNPRVTSINVPWTYTLVTEWTTAMKLTDRPGKMLWLGRGTKTGDASRLPADVLRAIEPIAKGRVTKPLAW